MPDGVVRGAVGVLGDGMFTVADICETCATAVLARAAAKPVRFCQGGGANGLPAGATA